MENQEKILIDHFYIEGAVLYAIEKVTGQVQGPPRMFSLQGRDGFGNATEIEVIEINYR